MLSRRAQPDRKPAPKTEPSAVEPAGVSVWHRYQDRARDSGIAAYAIGRDAIAIEFKAGGTYVYTAASAGREHLEEMKRLADRHGGLTTYINQHVRENYAVKLP